MRLTSDLPDTFLQGQTLQQLLRKQLQLVLNLLNNTDFKLHEGSMLSVEEQ